MDCPKCGAFNENPVGSCLSCGAPLPDSASAAPPAAPAPKSPPRSSAARLAASNVPPKQCPSCSTLNAATFKFCARCGTPLGATGVPLAPPKPPPPAAAKAAPKPAPARAPPPGSGAKAAPKPAPRSPPPSPSRPAPKPAPPPPPRPRARISAIARDGSTSADFVLTRDETRVGSQVSDGDVKLEQDPFIGPVHAIFKFENDQLTVRDTGTHNGVFLWLKSRELKAGDELRVGRQRLRIEWLPDEAEAATEQPLWGSPDPGYLARAVQLLEGGGEGDVYPLKPGDNSVGRGAGDLSFPSDGYVSSRHAVLTVQDGALSIKDLGSANGTFVRISESASLTSGDLLLVGEQILRIDPP
jgi:pSer/pThr/pTyr-binding forkhead associated (FHA) protein